MLFKDLVKGDIFILGLSDEEFDGNVYMRISGNGEYLVDTIELNPSVCFYSKDKNYIGEVNMISDSVPVRKLRDEELNKYLLIGE
jgi:hypothetical protein